MTGLRLYIHPTCSTCRKAIAWLHQNGHVAEQILIADQPPPRAELAEALRQLGSRQRLFNTSGQRYRALGAERIRSLSDAEALDLLAEDGMLIRRPFLVTASGRITVGFKAEDWQALLESPLPN